MEFAIGFACGMAITFGASWIFQRYEWVARRKLEQRVDKLYRHLACGAGIIGCSGGPNCKWDHK